MPRNYAKDILGNLSEGVRLAWCTISPPTPHVSKRSAASTSSPGSSRFSKWPRLGRRRLCLNNTVQKDSRGLLGTTFRFGRLSEILGKYPIWRTEHSKQALKRPRNKVFTVHFTPFMYSACLNMKLASNCSMSSKKTFVSRR